MFQILDLLLKMHMEMDQEAKTEVVSDEVMYVRFSYTAHPKLTCSASTTTMEGTVKVVKQKTGSKSAKRR